MRRFANTITNAMSRYARDTRANVAMIFGLSLVPIIMLAGFSIDYSRQLTSDRHLQVAIDAASLAGAKALENSTKTDADIVTIATAAYQENLLTSYNDLSCGTANITINREAGTVNVDAACTLPTSLGGATWKSEVGVVGTSQARAALTKLDLAFMLDVSGSMGGQKLTDLKQAARNAAATLVTPETGDRVRVSFNTYASSVNSGIYAPNVLENGGNPGVSNCVSEREGFDAWTDDAPGTGKWLGDDATSCPASSVQPLTTDLTVFNAGIDAMAAGGGTAGHLGVAWAWYLISPEWQSIWPAASRPRDYTEPNSKKAVILMTDGQFNRSYSGLMGSSNVQAKRMCQNMRDQGVLVYAVAFQAPSSAKATLRDCAGTNQRFFDASNGDELNAAYDAIASQLSNLALVG